MYSHIFIRIQTQMRVWTYIYRHIHTSLYVHMSKYIRWECCKFERLPDRMFVPSSWSYAHGKLHPHTHAYTYHKYIPAPILVWLSEMSTCNTLIVQRSGMKSCSSQWTHPIHPVVLRKPVNVLHWRVQAIQTFITKIEPRVQKWFVKVKL